LVRLVTDPEYRNEFLNKPGEIGNEAGISSDELEDIVAILPSELNFFSNSLIWKRQREVKKKLPLVHSILSTDFESAFQEFAGKYNPKMVNNHLEDAMEFCKFLERRHDSADSVKDAAKFERTKLEFFGFAKKLSICFSAHDFRGLSSLPARSEIRSLKKRRSFAVWLHLGRRIFHFIR